MKNNESIYLEKPQENSIFERWTVGKLFKFWINVIMDDRKFINISVGLTIREKDSFFIHAKHANSQH